jgi:predicted ABC-type ATPase
VSRPRLLVFAGPNGSGKSTISSNWPVFGVYVNADEIKAATGCTDLEAAQAAETQRLSCLQARRDFTFETVLSTDRNLKLMRVAQDSGYRVTGVFVLTVNAELNVGRVRSRVAAGGHDVPRAKTIGRWSRSVANLREFIDLSHEAYVIDNTGEPDVVFHKDAAGETFFPNQHWPESSLRQLTGR